MNLKLRKLIFIMGGILINMLFRELCFGELYFKEGEYLEFYDMPCLNFATLIKSEFRLTDCSKDSEFIKVSLK